MLEWKNIFRGMVMGLTELIPGVSSSTLAMLMGFYERLLGSINDLTNGHWRRAFRFLIPLGIGMVLALLSLAKLLNFLTQNHPEPTFFLFMGLILGVLPFLWRSAHRASGESFRGFHYMIICIAFVLVALMSFVGENEAVMTDLTTGDYIYLFVCGWIASTALILPGISGSMMFLLLGAYGTAINALDTFNLPVMAAVGLGVLVGVLITSKVVRYFLKVHTQATYAVMIGLVAGSLPVVFPGVPAPFLYGLLCLLTFIIGFIVALALGRAGRA
ncbi:DUF368 domain-containing protein [Shouchella shacheensis]|uniref:DUF368 domain-containing protein n=1 Tax=Shouchella shacheensis TaxID=1649580 RepID=UPI00073FC00E|nr:DUF368 domain-containing protein [Shouchella shacheensis]